MSMLAHLFLCVTDPLVLTSICLTLLIDHLIKYVLLAAHLCRSSVTFFDIVFSIYNPAWDKNKQFAHLVTLRVYAKIQELFFTEKCSKGGKPVATMEYMKHIKDAIDNIPAVSAYGKG